MVVVESFTWRGKSNKLEALGEAPPATPAKTVGLLSPTKLTDVGGCDPLTALMVGTVEMRSCVEAGGVW